MTINIPIELGDPVIKISFNQHDGYYIDYTGFSYNLINAYNDGLIFTTYAEAKNKLEELDRNACRVVL